MKLSQKFGKLTQPLTYRRGWRRALRSIFRLPFAPLLAGIDQERLREIQQRYAGGSEHYSKYADVDHWLHFPSALIGIFQRADPGARRNGIFFCAICSGNSHRAAKYFLD